MAAGTAGAAGRGAALPAPAGSRKIYALLLGRAARGGAALDCGAQQRQALYPDQQTHHQEDGHHTARDGRTDAAQDRGGGHQAEHSRTHLRLRRRGGVDRRTDRQLRVYSAAPPVQQQDSRAD